jgi:hypothetical protein
MPLDHVPPSDQVCEEMRERSDTCMLAFSAGKDAIAAWIQLRRFFPKIIPFFMYLIPDLGFVNDDLAYYEDFFGTRIIRVPHPSLYRMLNNLVFQPPERVSIIQAAGLANFDYQHVVKLLREDLQLSTAMYSATGVRAADSPQRYMAVKRYGAINHRQKSFFPIWDWNKERMRRELLEAKVKLGIQYRWFGRSFDGIDWRFLSVLKTASPKDYATIKEWFPLVDVEILRREYAKEKV